jgi:nitrate/nitrite transporter NarK
VGVQPAAGLAMINSTGPVGGFYGPNIFGIAQARIGDLAAMMLLLTDACPLALLAVFGLRRLVGRNPVSPSPVEVEA